MGTCSILSVQTREYLSVVKSTLLRLSLDLDTQAFVFESHYRPVIGTPLESSVPGRQYPCGSAVEVSEGGMRCCQVHS